MPTTLTFEQQKEYMRRIDGAYRFIKRDVRALEARGASDAEIQALVANFSNEWYPLVLLPGELERGLVVGKKRSQGKIEVSS